MNILVIDDEPRISEFLSRALRAEGWCVSTAGDGDAGLRMALAGGFDVIILDMMLPQTTGIEVCRALRSAGSATPVMMLTAIADVGDRVAGLRQGADDYLGKPFDLDELLARVEALGRRGRTPNPPAEPNACGPLRFDPATLQLTVEGKPVALTRREREVIRLLLSSPGRVFSRERILNAVWSLNEDPLTNITDVYVARLRRKLGRAGALIETVRGAGYRLRVDAGAEGGRS